MVHILLLSMFSSGHLGEYVPYNSGLLSVIKAHGYIRVKGRYSWSYPEDLISEMLQTNGKAVVLIRNPYRAIYSYRNHMEGHTGHANISQFLGLGNLILSNI